MPNKNHLKISFPDRAKHVPARKLLQIYLQSLRHETTEVEMNISGLLGTPTETSQMLANLMERFHVAAETITDLADNAGILNTAHRMRGSQSANRHSGQIVLVGTRDRRLPKSGSDSHTCGRRDCFRTSRLSAPCEVCGARNAFTHVPLTTRGFYCDVHCPIHQPAQDKEKNP
jgi:hypothetical protein